MLCRKNIQRRRSLILRALQRLVNITLAIAWSAWQQSIQTTPVEEGPPLPGLPITNCYSIVHPLIAIIVPEDDMDFLPSDSPDPIYPKPVSVSVLAIGQGKGQGKGEVVKTYRRAVFQVFKSCLSLVRNIVCMYVCERQGGDSSVVYKTFALVRRAKGNTEQQLHHEPSKISHPHKTTTKLLMPSLSLEERMRARLASAHALGAEFDRRYSARHGNQKKPLA